MLYAIPRLGSKMELVQWFSVSSTLFICAFVPMDTFNLSHVLFLALTLDLRDCGSQSEEALI